VALYKYLGPYAEVRVSVAGTEVGTVAKDESISVPDELADLSEWPEEHWLRADTPKASKKTEDK